MKWILFAMAASSEAARSRYQGEAGRSYHETKRDLPSTALSWVANARAELFSAYVRPEHAVFEYGCGYGWNLMRLNCRRRAGYDVSETVHAAIEAAGLELVRSSNAIPDAVFDLAICHHCLEHLPDPLAVLDELRRVLKPGGVTLLAVPFETGSQYRSFNPIEPNHHLFSWNVQTLGNLVVTAGFKVRTTELRKYGYDRFAAKLAVRLKWGEKGFRFLRSLGWILKPLREVTVVAEKAEASGRNDVGREITG